MSKDTATKTKPETKVIEEEVKLTEDDLKEISKHVGTTLMPELTKQLSDANKKQLDEFLAKIDKPVTKAGVKDPDGKGDQPADGDDPIQKGIKAKHFGEDIVKMTPAMRFYEASRALAQEDFTKLKRYNRFAIASQLAKAAELNEKGDMNEIGKAGYMNETTAADGAVLVPDADFIQTVFDNLPNYGVAFQYADVRQTDRTSVRVITLDSGLTFYSTAEAGVKTSAKLQFSKGERSLTKYAVIVPATDELSDDAAIDFWNLVTRELTRAYAKKADEITFTDSTTGITNTAGVITEPVSGAGTTITWDDLLNAEGKGEEGNIGSDGDYRWFMRKETWFRLLQTKAASGSGDYLWGAFKGNPNRPTTPWGTEVVFTRVLPRSGGEYSDVVGSNDAFAVYGNLRNYILFNKRGMQLKLLTEATIVDSEGTNLNLATQDASAMRAVVRMLGILPKGNAPKFVVVGTGTVS